MTPEDLQKQIQETSPWIQSVRDEMAQVLVGQSQLVDRLLIGLLCNGHILLEGVPGLAKTLAVKALSGSLSTSFSRFQFTPDLLPADLVGTMVYHPQITKFEPKLGPIFNNLILADEINRAPAKVQSALLEAMQERQVTIGEHTYPLPKPFLVMATQNPIEQEGTYVLPEAQADRFMFCLNTTYPSRSDEERVVRETTGTSQPIITPVITGPELIEAQKLVRSVPVSDEVIAYAVRLVSRTRPETPEAPSYIREFVRWGASPRASQFLVLGAKANALPWPVHSHVNPMCWWLTRR